MRQRSKSRSGKGVVCPLIGHHSIPTWITRRCFIIIVAIFIIKQEFASMITTIRRFYNKYRNFLEFNKNLIISGTVAFFVSAAITQLYSNYNNSDFWTSIVSILTGFSISIPLFAFLFYMDNKHSRKDKKSFRTVIIKKIVALYSISNLVNVVVRFIIIYELLKLEVEPYEASMLSSLCASGLSYFVTNLASKFFKLFKSSENGLG